MNFDGVRVTGWMGAQVKNFAARPWVAQTGTSAVGQNKESSFFDHSRSTLCSSGLYRLGFAFS
jgi:hypothetical protein